MPFTDYLVEYPTHPHEGQCYVRVLEAEGNPTTVVVSQAIGNIGGSVTNYVGPIRKAVAGKLGLTTQPLTAAAREAVASPGVDVVANVITALIMCDVTIVLPTALKTALKGAVATAHAAKTNRELEERLKSLVWIEHYPEGSLPGGQNAESFKVVSFDPELAWSAQNIEQLSFKTGYSTEELRRDPAELRAVLRTDG